MNASLDRDTAALANAAGAPYARYLQSADLADFNEAHALMSEAIARARAGGMTALPGLLFNMSHLHHARYVRTRDRDALGEAYALLVEASVRSDDREIEGRLVEIAQLLLQTIDTGRLDDVRWYADLQRSLVGRVPGDRLVVWANLALALRWLLNVTDVRDRGLLREFGEASERAGGLAATGSPAAVRAWGDAATVLPFLAGVENDAALARRAARACEMAIRERADTPADVTDVLLLCRVLAYELDGQEQDRVEVSRYLPPNAAPSERFMSIAQDVVASLLRGGLVSGDSVGRAMATELAAWCVRRLTELDGARSSELPGLLNGLGACLVAQPGASSRPAPWQGWPSSTVASGHPVVRQVPGAAAALASRVPFVITRGVEGPIGKVYLDEAFTVVAAQWDGPVSGHALSHVQTALLLPPQSAQSAEPLVVPSRTHTIAVTITAPGGEITGLRAVVEARTPLDGASVDVIMAEDAPPAAAANILLDFDPPLVWPAFEPVSVPGTLVVRAITENDDVRWRLEIDGRFGGQAVTLTVALRTSGERGFRRFVADSEVVRAPGHIIGSYGPAGRGGTAP